MRLVLFPSFLGNAPNYYPNSFSGPKDDPVCKWSKFNTVSLK